MVLFPNPLLIHQLGHAQVAGGLVGEQHRELDAVTEVQLAGDGAAPADELLLALGALQVLCGQVVEAVHVQHLAHARVQAQVLGGQVCSHL